jgi:DmsE family decaheme c-type cytochrome
MHSHRWSAGLLAGAMCALTLAMVVRLSGAPAGAGPPDAASLQSAPAGAPAGGPAPQAPPQPMATPAAKPDGALAPGFVGDDDTCLTCHENQTMKGTPHGRERDVRTPAAKQGCETCHGPGQAHVDAKDNKGFIRVFDKKAVARDTSAMCLSCHTKGTHVLWEGSPHDARNLSCATCHSVHAPKSVQGQLIAVNQEALCVTCHRPQVLKTRRQAHMPQREGAMSCSSCHNPHGATNVRLLKTGNWINESCASCHAEKRGPFLFEHAAGRESCVSCHDPHGSNHDRMLVARPPMLCQRCHIGSRHPSTIYDATQLAAGSNRMLGRSCVNCHSTVHGSNHPAGGTFLR